jgi:hypothetical protein
MYDTVEKKIKNLANTLVVQHNISEIRTFEHIEDYPEMYADLLGASPSVITRAASYLLRD